MNVAWTQGANARLRLRLLTCVGVLSVLSSFCLGQVPDLVTGFDAGGRAFGSGGAFYVTGADTISAVINPSGLGYMDRAGMSMALRNLPKTSTTVTGDVTNLRLDSKETDGSDALTHLGWSFPMHGRSIGSGGAFSLAYTVTGFMNDHQHGVNLLGGIDSYDDTLQAKTKLITLTFGRASASRTWSWGAGIAYALQHVQNRQVINFNDPGIPDQITDLDNTGNGVGAILGFMFTPANHPELSFGFSAQSPIKLNGGGAIALYSKIPGRVSAGISHYRAGMRQGRDFLVIGSEADYYFGGAKSDRVDRTKQLVVSAGLEYGYGFSGAIIPIRLGYRWVQAGGKDFVSRNGMTFGFGYRPLDGNWGLEFNFGATADGTKDHAYSLFYHFKK